MDVDSPKGSIGNRGMEILCKHCQSRFKIAREKLPSRDLVCIKCPKCNSSIEIHTPPQARAAAPAKAVETMINEVASAAYDPSEKPFDYVEAGVQTALVCEHDPGVKQNIRAALERMNYHVVEAASTRNALKYMRFHVYNLVVLNETFEAADSESNHALQYLAQLPMNIRRNIFVVLVGNRFSTMDNMMAFNKSVNLVVNLQNVDDIENILKGALAEHEESYLLFKESLKKAGRA